MSDPEDAWIFHISPDDTQESAIWVAQHVPSDHIAVVANMFVIREMDLNSSDFMYSSVRCLFLRVEIRHPHTNINRTFWT